MYQIKNDPQYFYRISIKALIFDDQKKFLLLQEKDGSRSLPWWWLAQWDTLEQSLHIKIPKELWVHPIWISSNPYYFITATDDHDPEERKGNIIYEVRLSDHKFTLWKDEHAYRFFSKDEATKVSLTKNTIEFVHLFDPQLHS